MIQQINNQIRKPELKTDNILHVVGAISNHVRYHSRYRLYREWLKALEATPNVIVYTVEAAFNDRHHEVTDAENPRNLQVRTHSPIWIKENLINLGVKHLLPKDWKYLCWSDCDVFWRDPNWAQEALHQLQHYSVIQPWQDCLDLGPQGTVLEKHTSFGSLIARGIRRQKRPNEAYVFGHPGFAWACTRGAYEAFRGLEDGSILGSGDHHMAAGLVNEVQTSIHDKTSEGFKKRLCEWQKRAYRYTNGIIGYVPTLIEHRFHGAKKRRYYRERWQILVDHGFDPLEDLTYDEQGVIQLIGKPKLLHEIHRYNLSRQEDSIDEV